MRPLPAILALLLCATSCTQSPPADKLTEAAPQGNWAIYTEIVGRDPKLLEDLPRCTAMDDASLAGDCALTVALGVAKAQGIAPQTHCSKVPEGMWKDECFFIAAERARSSGKVDLAVKLCEQAGRFTPDCAFHLWQRAMRTLAKRIVLSTMVDQQDQMRTVHKRWAKRVGHISDFDDMFWRKLFRAVWDGVARVDPGICSNLEPDLAERCVLGARIHLDHALRASLRQEAWATAFCEGDAPAVDTLGELPEAFPELNRFPAHPLHQATVESFHQTRCTTGKLPPHPDPPRRVMTDRPSGPAKQQGQGRTDAPTQSR